jgi:hypothetical protein
MLPCSQSSESSGAEMAEAIADSSCWIRLSIKDRWSFLVVLSRCSRPPGHQFAKPLRLWSSGNDGAFALGISSPALEAWLAWCFPFAFDLTLVSIATNGIEHVGNTFNRRQKSQDDCIRGGLEAVKAGEPCSELSWLLSLPASMIE